MDQGMIALRLATYILQQYTLPSFYPIPVLGARNPGLQSAKHDSISTALSVLENHMNHLDRISRLVHAKKDSLRLRRALLKGALAPMSSLPQELLRDICALAVESAPSAYAATRTALAISHTSSAWRTAALGQSSIWARVDFQGFHQSLAKIWVERSRYRPLSLTLHSARVGLGTILSRADAQRLTYLAVSDEDDEDDQVPDITIIHQLNSLAGTALPALETLWLQSTHSHMYETFTVVNVNALRLAVPALRNLHLFGVSIQTFASLGRTLTSLRMESVFGILPEWDEIMTSCPVLETLTIVNGISQSTTVAMSIGPWIMPRLRTLALQDCDTMTVHALFKNLKAPNLVEFFATVCDRVDEAHEPELSLHDGGEIGDELCVRFFPFFFNNSPHLLSMTMRGLPYRLAGLVEVIHLGLSRYPQNLVELRSLTVECTHLPENEWHPEYSSDWRSGTKWLAIAIETLVASLIDVSGIRRTSHLKTIALSSDLIVPGGVTSCSSIDLLPLPNHVEFDAYIDKCEDQLVSAAYCSNHSSAPNISSF